MSRTASRGFGGDRQHVRLPGSRGLPEAAAEGVRRPGPLAAQDAGLQRADRGARPAGGRRRSTSTISRRRLGGVERDGRVHERGLAGRGLAVLPQRALSEPGGLSLRHRRGDAARIRGDRQRGLRAADRLPRPRRWAGTSSMPTSTCANSARPPRMHIEALNHALANIPAEQLRMHLCWGNYEGPHHCDVPLADIIDIVFTARPERHLVRGRQSAPRARVDAVRDGEAARTARC